ncbi:MAG: indolepyruvate oxidoreductase subunit beta [Deltaproteobacteria bacterium]|nr:indolepyruvate oxidoreductase subunit beta [Deltaproteobacteria bacterium]
MAMALNIIITGVGGQGNVLASQIIGRAAVNRGYNVTIGETFGLSQRGGPVMSHIRLSENKTCGPLIPPNMAHMVVGLEPLETLRVLKEFGNSETVFIANARPIYPLNVIAGDVEYPDLEWIRDVLDQSAGRLYWLDATDTAVELGGPIMLNMILLGALCSLSPFPLDTGDIETVLTAFLPDSKLPANIKALAMGAELIHRYEN